jgi:1-deoxy-D-xylulose-5-phosphate reductoisomerase
LCRVSESESVDVVLASIVGFAGLAPVMSALRRGKRVALANKETLVAAGALVREALLEDGGELLPVDSEHSAIFQCVIGEAPDSIEELILTASGGPFRTRKC